MGFITVNEIRPFFRKDKFEITSDSSPSIADVEGFIEDISVQIQFSLEKGLKNISASGFTPPPGNPYLKYACKIGTAFRISETAFELLMKDEDSRARNLKKEYDEFLKRLESDPSFIDASLMRQSTVSGSPVYSAPERIFGR